MHTRDNRHHRDRGSSLFPCTDEQLAARVASETANLVAISGPDGHIAWVNQAFQAQTGYALSEAVGVPWPDLLFDRGADATAVQAIRELLRSGQAFTDDWYVRRRDGRRYWCTLGLSPLRTSDGQLEGWIAIGSDSTDAHLAREALERAKCRAEDASRAKSEFLANMSHEIRTPMNAILGMTDLALGTELADTQRDYLVTVRQSASSLLKILNDILDLSKIEAQRMELEEVDFNLADLVRETMRPLTVQAEAKGLQLTWHLPREVVQTLRGDPTRLRQVLVNLVGNALKFTARGVVALTIERQWSSGGEVGLLFTVRDTGIGIPPDRLGRIFEAFTQADSSTTRRYGGTGLGLTITAELLRLMNGRIWVQSREGHGSEFSFQIRFRQASQPDSPPRAIAGPELAEQRCGSTIQTGSGASADPLETTAAPTPTGRVASGTPFTPLRILIADDHLSNRQLLAEIVRRRGHVPVEVASGREVLDHLRQTVCDVVLMDVQMDGMDGFEVTARIRDLERSADAHQPIVAVTAYAMKGDREKCIAAGMDAYLPKPIDAAQLIHVCETLAAAIPSSSRGPLQETVVPPAAEPASGGELRPPLSTGSAPVTLDLGPALERLAGDRDLLRRQIGFFLEEAPQLLERLRTAIARQDAATLRLYAHRLKGLVGSFDDRPASHAALQLESCAQEHRLDDAPPLAAELRHHIEQLLGNLRRYLCTEL